MKISKKGKKKPQTNTASCMYDTPIILRGMVGKEWLCPECWYHSGKEVKPKKKNSPTLGCIYVAQ